ncbi:MAG: aminotransferase class V-fold PLP-dependent enzyme [Pirellulaceae bacterium]|nr:aminotransferase class V-fold PLP-dependent enzyme [Pirellulaceae bacterium]
MTLATYPWPLPDADVLSALAAAYQDGSWGKYDGPNCQSLEKALRELNQVEHAFLCSSGTIAVELALRGLKIGPGDEVILAGYDFPGNFRAVEAVGAKPVLVDLIESSWSLDGSQIPLAVSPQTKAVIASHLHGSLVDMRSLMTVAQEHGLAVVEDACQAPGALVQGKPAGSWGDVGVHSFGGSKLLTAGRGGALVTRREEVLQRIKIFSERGNQAFPLSELQAAALLPQIPKLAVRNEVRWKNVNRLHKAVSGQSALQPLPLPQNGDIPAFYKLGWLLAPSLRASTDPEAEQIRLNFVHVLQQYGLPFDSGFRGFARRTTQRCRVVGELPHARKAANSTLLMHHPVLLQPPETIDQVAAVLWEVAVAFSRGEHRE